MHRSNSFGCLDILALDDSVRICAGHHRVSQCHRVTTCVQLDRGASVRNAGVGNQDSGDLLVLFGNLGSRKPWLVPASIYLCGFSATRAFRWFGLEH